MAVSSPVVRYWPIHPASTAVTVQKDRPEAMMHRSRVIATKPADMRRIRPVRVTPQNQRDAPLAYAGALDEKLTDIAQSLEIS
jgi:hypothetical protein